MIAVILLLSVSALCYIWLKFRANYWKGSTIPSIPAKILIGNLGPLVSFKRSVPEAFQDLYNHENAKDESVVGITLLTQPGLMIRDPEIIKHILVKNFNSFSNRFTKTDKSDKLGAYNLFFARNSMWRQMRAKLTPFFTSGRLKQMFPLVKNIGDNFGDHFNKYRNGDCVEIRDYAARFATDIIASCAFGLDVNSIEDPHDEFRKNGEKVFEPKTGRIFEFISSAFIPALIPIFRSKVFSSEANKFLTEVFTEVLNKREKNKLMRKDLIDMMIELKNDNTLKMKDDINWCDEVLVAQPAFFFSAGFETTSTTISFALYEMAKHPDIQNRVRSEIRDVLKKNNGEFTYDCLSEMQYLGMVISETLRFWPPVGFLDRELSESTEYSLKPFGVDFKIPPSIPLYISIYGLHHDPKYYPEPEKFDPERFSPENKRNINQYAYLPFGTGPHNCIGDRFAQITVRIGIASLLKDHRVELASDNDRVLHMAPKTFIMRPAKGINLRLIKDKLYSK